MSIRSYCLILSDHTHACIRVCVCTCISLCLCVWSCYMNLCILILFVVYLMNPLIDLVNAFGSFAPFFNMPLPFSQLAWAQAHTFSHTHAHTYLTSITDFSLLGQKLWLAKGGEMLVIRQSEWWSCCLQLEMLRQKQPSQGKRKICWDKLFFPSWTPPTWVRLKELRKRPPPPPPIHLPPFHPPLLTSPWSLSPLPTLHISVPLTPYKWSHTLKDPHHL